MILAWVVVAGEVAAAFLTLDLFFRYMPLDPGTLQQRLLRSALLYTAIATVSVAGGAIAQWVAGGTAGLIVAALNWLPWWLLWRFGLRKQFTYLFKSDGGRPLSSKKPGP